MIPITTLVHLFESGCGLDRLENVVPVTWIEGLGTLQVHIARLEDNTIEIFHQGGGKRLMVLGTHQNMELRPGVSSGNHFPKTPGTTQGFRVIPLQHKKGLLQFPDIVSKHGLPPGKLAVWGLVLVVGEDVEPKNSWGWLPRVKILQCRNNIEELLSPGMRNKGGGLTNVATASGVILN